MRVTVNRTGTTLHQIEFWQASSHGHSWFSATRGPEYNKRKNPAGFSGSWIRPQVRKRNQWQQPPEGCLYQETKLFHWKLDTCSRACKIWKAKQNQNMLIFLFPIWLLGCPSLSLFTLLTPYKKKKKLKKSSVLKLCVLWGACSFLKSHLDLRAWRITSWLLDVVYHKWGFPS